MHSTSLPTICTGGVCARKHCYEHSDCPQGYGCDGAGMCKKVGIENYRKLNFECLTCRTMEVVSMTAIVEIVVTNSVSERFASARMTAMFVPLGQVELANDFNDQ